MIKAIRCLSDMSEFIIDPRLGEYSDIICELDLCRLILKNNALFPWVMLVPRKNNLREIIDLSEEELITFMKEISLVSRAMQDVFNPDKLNVAALGNVVPQLHIHIIARYKSDVAWPDPVFNKGSTEYNEEQRFRVVEQIYKAIEKYYE